MNIKTRLKKLEQEIGSNVNDEICQCFDKDMIANIKKVYGEPYNETDILPENTIIGDFCDRCKKPVPEQIRKMYRDIEMIYGDGAREKLEAGYQEIINQSGKQNEY